MTTDGISADVGSSSYIAAKVAEVYEHREAKKMSKEQWTFYADFINNEPPDISGGSDFTVLARNFQIVGCLFGLLEKGNANHGNAAYYYAYPEGNGESNAYKTAEDHCNKADDKE